MIKYLASSGFSSALMNFTATLLLATLTIVVCVVGYVTIKEILKDD